MNSCWICGGDATEHRNIGERDPFFGSMTPYSEDSQRCYCTDCFQKVKEQLKEDQREYIRLKKKLMFERAVRTLERQNIDIYDYQEAIQAVGEFAEEKPDKFDSSYEMVAAIILINHGFKCELQKRIGKYQVDFYIPSIKVVLEIDGDRHKHQRESDSWRDIEIKNKLGAGWNMVRIGTENLDTRAESLIRGIYAVLENRSKKIK